MTEPWCIVVVDHHLSNTLTTCHLFPGGMRAQWGCR